MPKARHFWRRQCWHRFRLVRSIRQFLWREQEYMALFCWLRRKKPWTQRRTNAIRKMHIGATGEDTYGEPGFTLGVWSSSPCSLRRWWLHSGFLRTCPHRSYRGWPRSELQGQGRRQGQHVVFYWHKNSNFPQWSEVVPNGLFWHDWVI